MATTPKQRKGARQLGIRAGLEGGPEVMSAEDLRGNLGPLSVFDLDVVRRHYSEGYRSVKQAPESSLTGRSCPCPANDRGQGEISSPGGGS